MRTPRILVVVLFLLTISANVVFAEGQPQRLTSNRLIVELESAPVAQAPQTVVARKDVRRPLQVNDVSVRAEVEALKAEQDEFIASLRRGTPGARLVSFRDEHGRARDARFHLVLNAVVVEPETGTTTEELKARLLAMPGVKAVHHDHANQLDLYSSLGIINAPILWNVAGGKPNAGRGVRIASMDGGIHHQGPMFSGTGFSYPAGYPLGDVANTNGKIIASRAYFRPSDPPTAGDENTWPGTNGTSHGVHTASTAGGNEVTADYLGFSRTVSGVAPAAWLMSYRVFYASVSGDGSFYEVEGLAALEDIVADGADVVNNSWGGGPTSSGGAHDALDSALINASAAGIFVSMSAGNSGPGVGTGDHPSSDYITVAATTTGSRLTAGRLDVIAPAPVDAGLENVAFSAASFGPTFPAGENTEHDFVAASMIDAANLEGCNPFPAGSFSGRLAVIMRGTCEFAVKVLNAQNAGAAAVIVYNHAAGGEGLINMGPGAVGGSVTIPSVFIGHTAGTDMVAWSTTHTTDSRLRFDMHAYDAGNTPDVVANFSSRGPGVGGVLKPDIAAPGVTILAQGYTPNTTGEARHLGYGQVSGTSMAAPHIAGAAAVLRQIHPDWSNAWIKSALMSTAKYLDIYNQDGSPAQPLDMGAGRLDLTAASNPGIILDPPSLSFGITPTGSVLSRTFELTSVSSTAETYTISTVYTGGGFVAPPAIIGMTVSPSAVTLEPGESATVTVSWDTANSDGLGDNQGYVVLTGDGGHSAHLPAWMRVTPATQKDVLYVDADGSSSLGLPDYNGYYEAALVAAGVTWDGSDVDALVVAGATDRYLPEPGALPGYRAVIYQTGDNYYSDGSFTVPTPPTLHDKAGLVDYVNQGGRVIAFGQDLSDVFTKDSFAFYFTLGATSLQDAVSDPAAAQVFAGVAGSPFESITLNLTAGAGDGADNQEFIDELEPSGDQVEPMITIVDGPSNLGLGHVALLHRDEPTLERPGKTFAGKALLFSFGLEGINDDTGTSSRHELLDRALAVVLDSATASLAATAPETRGLPAQLEAAMTSTHGGPATAYRWDFGDGSAFLVTVSAATQHTYSASGEYTVRVETVNELGTRAIGITSVLIPGIRGDINDNGSVDVADIFYLINYLFAGGPAPIGPGDVNGDGTVAVADIFYLINYLFAGGSPPPA